MTIRNGRQSSAVKAKGRLAEQAVCDYLQQATGKIVERRRLTGTEDAGDVAGLPWCIEVKSTSRLDLAGWVDEARREFGHAAIRFGASHWAVVHKKRGTRDAGKWYVTMDLEELAEIIRHLLEQER